MYFNNHVDYIIANQSSSKCLLGVGSNCGIYFVQRSTMRMSSTVKVAMKRKKRTPTKASKAGRRQTSYRAWIRDGGS